MGDRRTANFDGDLLIIGRGGGGEGVVMEGTTKVAFRNEEESEDDSTQTIHRRVLKASLVECLSCPLCDRLCRDASTIVECLHTSLDPTENINVSILSNIDTRISAVQELTRQSKEWLEPSLYYDQKGAQWGVTRVCSACLRKRLKDGKTKNICPKCSTDLGCHPFQLIRQDRLLSTIQMKLFPAGAGG